MTLAEVHIASCVAYAQPGAMEAAIRAIVTSGIGEVPRADERGRMVVLIERSSAAEVLDAIDAIRALEGVLAVHLAYQHGEPEEELQESP